MDHVFRNSFCRANAHVIYNFKSPTMYNGEYDFLLFIDVPYGGRDNYWRFNGCFVNSLAIAVRRLEMPEVIDVDNNNLYTEKGLLNFRKEIESDRMALRNYVHERIKNVKRFDIAVIYAIKAPNCNKKFQYDNIVLNKGISLTSAIAYAVNMQKSMYGRVNALLWTDGKKSTTWDSFVNILIETAEQDTKQGILTKRKMDVISKDKMPKEMEKLSSAMGSRICIIKGRPGTGKTTALLRLMHEEINKHHHCRLLTYNNMLVYDLRIFFKGIGGFNPTSASVSTLHKFFFDIYIKSPVRMFDLELKEVDKVFALCLTRVARFNALWLLEKQTAHNIRLWDLLRNSYRHIQLSERREYNRYCNYVAKRLDEFDIAQLEDIAVNYVEEIKDAYLKSYYHNRFLNGYNAILKQLYEMYHDFDAFQQLYATHSVHVNFETREHELFKNKYKKFFFDFLKRAERYYQNNVEWSEKIVTDFKDELNEIDEELFKHLKKTTTQEFKKRLESELKTIRRKVNWSNYVFVDEAQDCQLYEKALLLELFGSAYVVVASGGSSQLIRTPYSNDWSVCLGQRLLSEEITLKHISCRQKGNIVNFINAFSEGFNIKNKISIKEEMFHKGRVIIDCRKNEGNVIPVEIIEELYQSGKDYGCSNFENLLFLFPNNYLERETINEKDAYIDTFGYVNVKNTYGLRHLSDMKFPSHLNIVDATVNDKRNISIGQNSTRCMLYDSCRGVEAWNVFCIDLDTFYDSKMCSLEATEYAAYNADFFIKEQELRARYASLWCFMAMTRAMDTLYIRLYNKNRAFSRALLDIAERTDGVEIIDDKKGES